MKIKFDYKRKDQLYFSIQSIFRFPTVFLIILVFLINAIINIDQYQKNGIAVYILSLVLFMIFFIVFIIIATAALTFLTSIIKKDNSVICEHEMEFENDYFVEKTKLNENKYSWDAVTKCFVNKNYFLLYIALSTAHVIPKRYLTESESSGLLQLLKDRKLLR